MYVKSANLLLSFLLLGGLACKADTRVAEKKVSGACTLLSASDIQAVQGEAVSDMQGSERSSESLSTAQCFYRLPTFSRSVSLEVTRPIGGPESTRAAEEFWERRFGRGRDEEEREMAAEREMEKKRGLERKGERKVENEGERKEEDEREEEAEREKEAPGPQPVAGLGDAAFWSGNQLNSSLYVRKNNVIVRLSIGGPEEQSAKIKKATALAEKVINRL